MSLGFTSNCLRLEEVTKTLKKNPKTPTDSIIPSVSETLKIMGPGSPFTLSVKNRILGWVIPSLVNFLDIIFLLTQELRSH